MRSASAKISRRYLDVDGSKYPVPDASLRSENSLLKSFASFGLCCSCQDNQSWGRATPATFAALSFSASANQRNFEAVKDATKTEPTCLAISVGPPISEFSASAAAADLVSFQSRASRITEPLSSSATMPCCCPPIEIASTSSSPPASFIAVSSAVTQRAGFTSVPSGWEARPSRNNSPVTASRITTLQDCVEESTPTMSFRLAMGQG